MSLGAKQRSALQPTPAFDNGEHNSGQGHSATVSSTRHPERNNLFQHQIPLQLLRRCRCWCPRSRKLGWICSLHADYSYHIRSLIRRQVPYCTSEICLRRTAPSHQPGNRQYLLLYPRMDFILWYVSHVATYARPCFANCIVQVSFMVCSPSSPLSLLLIIQLSTVYD